MSGGSFNYLCYNLDGWHIDTELKDMLSAVFHAVEWSESGDTSRSEAEKEIYDELVAYMRVVVRRQ